MSPTEVIVKSIKNKFPKAAVNVSPDAAGYAVTVEEAMLATQNRIDAESALYATFDRMPLELLSKIHTLQITKP